MPLDLQHSVALARAVGQVAAAWRPPRRDRRRRRSGARRGPSRVSAWSGERRDRLRRAGTSSRTPRAAPGGPRAAASRAIARARPPAGRTRRAGPGAPRPAFATRLAAGCMRMSSSSNESRPSTGITISPSSTKRFAASARERLHDVREVPAERLAGLDSGVRLRSPSRNARQRKPSHLGSYCQPCAAGQLAGELSASIGA